MPRATITSTRASFADYEAYVSTLQRLACEPRTAEAWDVRTVAALDGQASAELRRIIPLETRRQFGAFFTGSTLAKRLIAHCGPMDARSIPLRRGKSVRAALR